MGRMGTPLVKVETLKLLIFLEELLDKGDTKLPACWPPFFFLVLLLVFYFFFSPSQSLVCCCYDNFFVVCI